MRCDTLPVTGLDLPLGIVVMVAIACIIAGATMLLLARSRGRGAAAALVLLLIAGVAGVSAPATPARAASGCSTGDNSLTITQTSSMNGIAPGIAPRAIVGVVTNNGADRTDITAIDVEITSVTTDPGSPPGACDASDYLLLDTRMPVGRTLDPGGSTTFDGAAIGFNNKTTSQDACQHATVHLLYTANPA